jgi:hypothetical protein
LKHNSRSNLTSHWQPSQIKLIRRGLVEFQLQTTEFEPKIFFWAPRMGYTSEPRPQGSNFVDICSIFPTEINNKRSAKWSINKRAAVQYYKMVVNLLNPTKKSCMLWSQYKTHILPCLLHDLFISIGIYQIGKICMNYQDNLCISWVIRRGWRDALFWKLHVYTVKHFLCAIVGQWGCPHCYKFLLAICNLLNIQLVCLSWSQVLAISS